MATNTHGYVYVRQCASSSPKKVPFASKDFSLTRTPVGVLAYHVKGDLVEFSYSLCADSDMKKFTKDSAKFIANVRLSVKDGKPKFSTLKLESTRKHDVIRAMLSHFVNDASCPKKLFAFSKAWLTSHPEKERPTVDMSK